MVEEEKNPEQELEKVATEEAVAPPKGRAAYLERYKRGNPDITEDPDDDALFDYASGKEDELTGKYEALNAPNQKLAEVISGNAQLAQFISMIASGENMWRALSKSFGDVLNQLDDESLSEYEKGLEETKAGFAKKKENALKFKGALAEYAKANGLPEERVNATQNAIFDLMDAFLDYDIPVEVIEIVDKGLHAEEDTAEVVESLTAEKDAEVLKNRNDVIEEIKGRKQAVSATPDLQGQRASGALRKPPVFKEEEYGKTPYIDSLEVVKKQ